MGLYDRDDQIDGTGTHSGVASDVLKSGDGIYQTFSGTHKTTTKADGSWEVNYQGVSIISGGTGPYKNAKGKLNYRGALLKTLSSKRMKAKSRIDALA